MSTVGGSCSAHHPPQRNEEGLGSSMFQAGHMCPFLSPHTHTTVPIPTPWPAHWGNMSPDTAITCSPGRSWGLQGQGMLQRDLLSELAVSSQEEWHT